MSIEKKNIKKKWNLENIEHIKEYNKNYYKNNKKALDYYHKNKDLINETKKEKMTCICGSSFNKHMKIRHEKSIKHNNYID